MYSKYESFIGSEVMKKIVNSLVAFCAVTTAIGMLSCGAVNTSVYAACPQGTAEVVTGGACSIKELQNLEKHRTEKSKLNFLPYGQRNLRPVRQQVQQTPKTGDDNCLFGGCLYKKLIEGQIR